MSTIIFQVLIAIDQLFNTCTFFLPGGAWADETFSARCWRMQNTRPFTILMPLVNFIFLDPDHCKNSFISCKERAYSPVEER